jgi:hypothetical protein
MPTKPDHAKREFIGFWLRATELRALPDGRFEIVVELTPRKRQTPRRAARERGTSEEKRESEAADER